MKKIIFLAFINFLNEQDDKNNFAGTISANVPTVKWPKS